MKPFLLAFLLPFSQLAQGSEHPQVSRVPVKTVGEILGNKTMLRGKNCGILGFARFSRIGQRGLLYRTLSELKRHRYQDAIFLQMDSDKLWRKPIPDGAYVLVRGYLDKELHGSLGVYPAHLIVEEIALTNDRKAGSQ
jgi:hypothetical protein